MWSSCSWPRRHHLPARVLARRVFCSRDQIFFLDGLGTEPGAFAGLSRRRAFLAFEKLSMSNGEFFASHRDFARVIEGNDGLTTVYRFLIFSFIEVSVYESREF